MTRMCSGALPQLSSRWKEGSRISYYSSSARVTVVAPADEHIIEVVEALFNS